MNKILLFVLAATSVLTIYAQQSAQTAQPAIRGRVRSNVPMYELKINEKNKTSLKAIETDTLRNRKKNNIQSQSK